MAALLLRAVVQGAAAAAAALAELVEATTYGPNARKLQCSAQQYKYRAACSMQSGRLAAGIHRCAQMSWPLDCYVWRYPDLMAGYCAGAYETCDWNVLSQHMKGVGLKEGRVLTCKSNDVRCYLQRYEDLRSFCVNGNISLCHWHDLMAQWHDAGQKE